MRGEKSKKRRSPTPEDKRDEEVRSVHELNKARALDLVGISARDDDPPDVEALLGGKRIGIEITRPVESEDLETMDRLHGAVIPRVRTLIAPLGAGQAGFGTHRLHLHHLDHNGLKSFSEQLADALVALATLAKDGESVCSGEGIKLRLVQSGRYPQSKDWTYHEVSRPPGVDLAVYLRNATTPVTVSWLGGSDGASWGPQLDTAKRLIDEKAKDLPRWPLFVERWLLLVGGAWARVTATAVQYDRTRFPDTGFDRIYLMDSWRWIKADPKVNVVRLDIFEEF
jgi:hypothetical protein